MTSFTTQETQQLKVTFQLKDLMVFPNQYDDSNPEEFMLRIAESIVDNCNGEVYDWELIEYDEGDDNGNLLPNTPYIMELTCCVSISGTCYYDPGRTYGDPYDCYPAEIDDVEYEDGMIDSCDTDSILATFDELASLSVNIGEVSDDGDIEIDD